MGYLALPKRVRTTDSSEHVKQVCWRTSDRLAQKNYRSEYKPNKALLKIGHANDAPSRRHASLA